MFTVEYYTEKDRKDTKHKEDGESREGGIQIETRVGTISGTQKNWALV